MYGYNWFEANSTTPWRDMGLEWSQTLRQKEKEIKTSNMLYVFRMDIGQMLTVNMSFLMDT